MNVVYHNRYCDVYSSDPASAPGRIESIHKELHGQFEFIQPAPATEEDIELVHSRSHIDSVKANTPVFEMALLAAGGAIEASKTAMKGEPAFGLIRPPGHHASRNSSWGFCYFNNVAVAIEKLRAECRIRRALIVDIDLHYGDGTANVFAFSSDVTYFHVSGWSRQTYMDELKTFLSAMHEPFDILAVSAGFDRHEQDWGGMLRTQDYFSIGKIVKEFAKSKCGSRRFAVLEGGYNHSVLGRNVKSMLKGMT